MPDMDLRGYGCNKCLKKAVYSKIERYILKSMEKHLTNILQMNAYTRTSKVCTIDIFAKESLLANDHLSLCNQIPQKRLPQQWQMQTFPSKNPPSSLCADLPSLKWICHWQLPLLDLQLGVTGWAGLGEWLSFCWQTILISRKQRSSSFSQQRHPFFRKAYDFLLLFDGLDVGMKPYLFVSCVRL